MGGSQNRKNNNSKSNPKGGRGGSGGGGGGSQKQSQTNSQQKNNHHGNNSRRNDDRSSTVPANSSRSSHRARLTAFYEKYNPEKLGQVDKVLKQYKGKEEQLFEALSTKYEPKTSPRVEDDDGEPRTPSESPPAPPEPKTRDASPPLAPVVQVNPPAAPVDASPVVVQKEQVQVQPPAPKPPAPAPPVAASSAVPKQPTRTPQQQQEQPTPAVVPAVAPHVTAPPQQAIAATTHEGQVLGGESQMVTMEEVSISSETLQFLHVYLDLLQLEFGWWKRAQRNEGDNKGGEEDDQPTTTSTAAMVNASRHSEAEAVTSVMGSMAEQLLQQNASKALELSKVLTNAGVMASNTQQEDTDVLTQQQQGGGGGGGEENNSSSTNSSKVGTSRGILINPLAAGYYGKVLSTHCLLVQMKKCPELILSAPIRRHFRNMASTLVPNNNSSSSQQGGGESSASQSSSSTVLTTLTEELSMHLDGFKALGNNVTPNRGAAGRVGVDDFTTRYVAFSLLLGDIIHQLLVCGMEQGGTPVGLEALLVAEATSTPSEPVVVVVGKQKSATPAKANAEKNFFDDEDHVPGRHQSPAKLQLQQDQPPAVGAGSVFDLTSLHQLLAAAGEGSQEEDNDEEEEPEEKAATVATAPPTQNKTESNVGTEFDIFDEDDDDDDVIPSPVQNNSKKAVVPKPAATTTRRVIQNPVGDESLSLSGFLGVNSARNSPTRSPQKVAESKKVEPKKKGQSPKKTGVAAAPAVTSDSDSDFDWDSRPTTQKTRDIAATNGPDDIFESPVEFPPAAASRSKLSKNLRQREAQKKPAEIKKRNRDADDESDSVELNDDDLPAPGTKSQTQVLLGEWAATAGSKHSKTKKLVPSSIKTATVPPRRVPTQRSFYVCTECHEVHRVEVRGFGCPTIDECRHKEAMREKGWQQHELA